MKYTRRIVCIVVALASGVVTAQENQTPKLEVQNVTMTLGSQSMELNPHTIQAFQKLGLLPTENLPAAIDASLLNNLHPDRLSQFVKKENQENSCLSKIASKLPGKQDLIPSRRTLTWSAGISAFFGLGWLTTNYFNIDINPFNFFTKKP
ncbi:MAG: hypothetical protein AB7R69_01295 [Candidatus Babeliales bacterium]